MANTFVLTQAKQDLFTWRVADATARAALQTTARDIGALARQLSDNTTWELISVNPSVWEQVLRATEAGVILGSAATAVSNLISNKRYIPSVSIFKYFTAAQISAWESRDITNALDAALATAHASELHLYYPPGRGKVTAVNGVALRPGQIVSGAAGTPYNQDEFASTLVNTTDGGSCFSYTGGTGGGDLPAPSVMSMRLEADNPILLNEVAGVIQNGSGLPSLIRPVIVNNYLYRKTAGVGRGISLTRCFDGNIQFNTVVGFGTGALLHGCDLNTVSNNRFQGCTTYGVQEQTALTFGSQNEISHNDILSYTAPGMIHIKAQSRHTRVYNNYLEATVSTKGFIDISTVDAPTFGSNTLTKSYSIEVTGNRIDGHHLASDFVLRLEPNAVYTKIHDTSTVGVSMPDWTKYFVVVGTYLPLLYTSKVRACIYDIHLDSRSGSFSSFTNNDDFDPFTTGLTPRNYARACNNDLSVNNASDCVVTDGESFVFLPTQNSTTVPDGAYMRFIATAADGTTNPWFLSGNNYNMSVYARTDNAAGESAAFGVLKGTTSLVSATGALTRQWNEYVRTFAGDVATAAAFGLRFASSITATGNRFVKKIIFSKVVEAKGTLTTSPNGSATAFTIPHGLGTAPTGVSVTPASVKAVGGYVSAVDATNITVTYGTAPTTGTNDLILRWTAKL